MTNWERYVQELKELVANGGELAVSDGKIENCEDVGCAKCDFTREKSLIDGCLSARRNWLNAEADSTLTAYERKLCELLKTGYIAQDNDGDIYHYTAKPVKGDKGNWGDGGEYVRLNGICGVCGATFEGIRDRKTKAWSVEELLALEVRD